MPGELLKHSDEQTFETHSHGAGSAGQLQQTRASAEQFSAAALSAIDRALSVDSTAFIQASRQESGQ